jgi:EAL domain-containing protein (putative c-di-GMP-specific phosphodiesterase class I)
VDSFGELLTVAEETGLSITLGRETVDGVCRRLRALGDALPKSDLSLTVNLTQRQFFHVDLLAQVKRTLAVTGVDPQQVMFEVAESALNQNPEAAAAVLQRLLDCGVRVAMDDFGHALAPLAWLVQMPIDMVKLHPRLAPSAVAGGRRAAILESVIRLGLNLGIQVVAQGIESFPQLDAFLRMGCELGQGPLLGSALEPAKVQRLAGRGFWELPERE